MKTVDTLSLSESVTTKVLLFRMSGLLYGAGLKEIVKLVADENLTPIPKTPEHLKGVILHEGKVVPVFSSAEVDTEPKTDKMVLLIEHPLDPIGLLVDAIEGVIGKDEMDYDEGNSIKYRGEPIEMVEADSIISLPAQGNN